MSCCCDPCVASCEATGQLPGTFHALARNFFTMGSPYFGIDGLYPMTQVVGTTDTWSFSGPPVNGSPFPTYGVLITLRCKQTVTPPPFGLPGSRFDFSFQFSQQVFGAPNTFGLLGVGQAYSSSNQYGTSSGAYFSFETFTSCAPPMATYTMRFGSVLPNFAAYVDLLA